MVRKRGQKVRVTNSNFRNYSRFTWEVFPWKEFLVAADKGLELLFNFRIAFVDVLANVESEPEGDHVEDEVEQGELPGEEGKQVVNKTHIMLTFI